MSILLTAKEVSKSYGARSLFSDIDFVIAEGDRVGLIGPNGAGKSTLLQILAGITSADVGTISVQKGLRIGYLEQTPKFEANLTVEESILSMDPDQIARAKELISKLSLEPFSSSPIESLSGGWKKRVALAKELMKDPDLFLLDEPTNHLDIESISWLETFISNSQFATLTITHDRLFLQRVSNRILELDRRNPKGLLNVRGNYSEYLKRKEELLATQQKLESRTSSDEKMSG